ncbi:hypothetical protein [Parvicella tangerina]|uniref:Uncharacterized protein n=1 Tax=Parvicella tangerina TaxID=2829795 RepID=A0A916JKG3_9FLAO|nr:hypothetical protein [Parvicella tangerina]CAG5076896.1 hypothetical protein CRYO30217_00236 [Parvicella tangerina]
MREQDKDHLRDFVNEHRAEFDDVTPPSLDFSQMGKDQQEDQGPKMIPITWLYRVAAVFVMILGLGAIWLLTNDPAEQPDVAEVEEQEEQRDFSLSELSPEMAEIEEYYSNELSTKQKELEALGYGDAISEELTLLDEEFNALKNELGENVDNHLIVNEMVKNYKLKLDLLESVLMDLQENYDDKNLTNLEDDENYTIYY